MAATVIQEQVMSDWRFDQQSFLARHKKSVWTAIDLRSIAMSIMKALRWLVPNNDAWSTSNESPFEALKIFAHHHLAMQIGIVVTLGAVMTHRTKQALRSPSSKSSPFT